MHKAPWTPELHEALRQMLQQGMSAAQIAKAMGRTRNAIIGEANRLRGVVTPRRVRYVAVDQDAGRTDDPRGPRGPANWRSRPVEDLPPVPGVEPLNVLLIDLPAAACRWPVSGVGAGTLFCGHAVTPGKRYCAAHAARSLRADPDSPLAEV